jgi:hypothetical protein
MMKKFAKILPMMLAFVMAFSGNAYGGNTETPSEIQALIDKIERLSDEVFNQNQKIRELQDIIDSGGVTSNPTPEKPYIMVVDPLSIEMDANTSNTFSITIKNLVSPSAKNILTTVKSATPGIVASFEGTDGYRSQLGNKASYKAKLNVSIDSTVKTGYYAIELTHAYLNSNNEEKTNTSSIQIKVDNKTAAGNLIIDNLTTSPQNIKAGSDFTLEGIIENKGNSSVSDVQVSIDGLKSEEIFIKNSTNIVSYPTMDKNISNKFSINLSSNKKLKNGSYPITLKLSYDNGGEARQTKEYSYYVSINDGTASEGSSSEVYIESISTPNSTIGVGQNFTMTAVVKNTSAAAAKNIKITAKPEGEGAIVPKSAAILQINNLNSGESQNLSFTFAPTAASKTQNYVIGFTLEYETGKIKDDDTKEVISFTQYQGVNVSNPEGDKKDEEKDEKTSVPKIIVKAYQSDPVIVKAGQEFDLSMTFLNTNAQKPIKNIKAYLTVDEGTEKKGSVFSPVNSSNTFYIDQMAPKGEVTKNLRFYTIPDASPKTYTINVNFEYEDMENNEYKTTEIVGISVKQVTKLDVSEFVIDETGFVGQPIYLNFEMYNTGKVTLSNLMIKVEGNFDANQKSTYYGSFNPSSTEYYDNTLIPTEAGSQTGKIVISYEDDAGEKVEEVKEFNIEIMESAPMEEGMGMMIDPETGFPLDPETGLPIDPATGLPIKKGGGIIKYVAIGAVVLAAAAGGAVLYRRKKKKESFDLNE